MISLDAISFFGYLGSIARLHAFLIPFKNFNMIIWRCPFWFESCLRTITFLPRDFHGTLVFSISFWFTHTHTQTCILISIFVNLSMSSLTSSLAALPVNSGCRSMITYASSSRARPIKIAKPTSSCCMDDALGWILTLFYCVCWSV